MNNDDSTPLRAMQQNAISRRRLIIGLGATATGAYVASITPRVTAFAAEAAQMMASSAGFRAVAFNHINYQVVDYAKIRDFYIRTFGMKCVWDDGKQCSLEFGEPPNAIYLRPLRQPPERPAGTGTNANWAEQMGTGIVDHLAFSIENFQLDAVKAELTRRGLNPTADGPFAWGIKDPSGLSIQICATRGVFPGQASPPARESDGLQHLDTIPKPDGSVFKAAAVNHLLMMVPDVDKIRDFYTDLLGMKVMYYKPGDIPGVDNTVGPACFLKFGESVIYVRKSLHPEHKPYIAHFAITVEDYEQAAVKTKLAQHGFQSVADTRYGWIIHDPAGMRIEVAGKGMAEHVAGDCNGVSQQCPGGSDK